MVHMKDAEIEKLKNEIKDKPHQLPQVEETKESIEQEDEVQKEDVTVKMVRMKDLEIEQLKKKIKELQEEDSKENTSEFGMQFDYWIPMEDLLHGAVVVSENVFNVHGDKEQIFNWTDCGFSLEVPQGTLSPDETCPVAIKALISGRFMFPKGFQLLSAVYAISPGGKFKKGVKATIQHCLQLEREEQLERLCFAKAYPTVCNTANPYYVFEIAKGGKFHIGSQLCEIWQRDFCHVCVGIRSKHDNDEDTNGSGSAGEQEQGWNENGEHEENESGDDEEGESSASSLTTPPPLATRTPPAETTPPSRTTRTHLSLSTPPSLNLPPSTTTPPVTMPSSLVTPSSTTTQASSTSEDEDTQLYRAHFFYEEIVANKWNFQLVTVKQLDVHIKFITDKYEKEEKIISFGFRFSGPLIELKFPDREKLPTGWNITPLTIPCSVSKEDIDSLSVTEVTVQSHEQQRVYADIPMCKAIVHAEDSPSTDSHIEYCVEITGMQERKSVVIVRWKSSNNFSVVDQSPISNTTSRFNDRAVEHNETAGITDLKKFKSSLIDQINHELSDLHSLFSFRDNLEMFANRLFQNGMISPCVRSNPDFDTLIREIITSLRHKRKPQDVIEHCKKFLRIMSEIGVPQKDVANSIAEDMEEVTQKEFNVTIKFD